MRIKFENVKDFNDNLEVAHLVLTSPYNSTSSLIIDSLDEIFKKNFSNILQRVNKLKNSNKDKIIKALINYHQNNCINKSFEKSLREFLCWEYISYFNSYGARFELSLFNLYKIIIKYIA